MPQADLRDLSKSDFVATSDFCSREARSRGATAKVSRSSKRVWLKMRYTCSVLSTNAAKSYNNRLEVLKILDDLYLTPPFNANYVGRML